PPPTFSPARLMTTSAFATSSDQLPCDGGFQATARPASTFDGLRVRTATSSPRASRQRTSGSPMNPLPPATTIRFIRPFCAQKRIAPPERWRGEFEERGRRSGLSVQPLTRLDGRFREKFHWTRERAVTRRGSVAACG